MKGCFMGARGSNRIDFVFADGRKERFAQRLELCPAVIHADNMEEHRAFLRETEVILCTWDMLPLTERELEEYFPALKLVLYAAGSVQYFARPFLSRGARICSAWGSMCYPVAQFTVSCIVLANKGAFHAARLAEQGRHAQGHALATEHYPGSYSGTKVGVLGAGKIGSLVIRALRQLGVEVLLFDPFCSAARAEQLGASLCSLETVFRGCQTVSNHLADNARTRGILDYRLFSAMRPDAAFINTGRGAQVIEPDLVRALEEEPGRLAVLDVTWPEPVEAGHAFLRLPNVVLFPHIAGYARREVLRMPDAMLEELSRYLRGEPLQFEVTADMLDTMA